MEHLEIEFKMLLKENIFKKILSDYKNQIKDSYQQTNYYLFHPLLEKKKYSLRIREKKGHYELTLKRPSTIGLNELNIDINKEIKDAIFNHQHINNEIFDILKKENIYIKDINDLVIYVYFFFIIVNRKLSYLLFFRNEKWFISTTLCIISFYV